MQINKKKLKNYLSNTKDNILIQIIKSLKGKEMIFFLTMQ